MLTTDQKEAILRRAGIALPAFPSPGAPVQQQQQQGDAAPPLRASLQAGAASGAAAEQWAQAIDALFIEYSAARAARSLHDAEEARRRGALQRAPGNAST